MWTIGEFFVVGCVSDVCFVCVHIYYFIMLNPLYFSLKIITLHTKKNNRGLYAPGQLWLEREDILGKAVGTLRYVGMVTIALNDYPVLKYVLVGMMGLFVLTSKEG